MKPVTQASIGASWVPRNLRGNIWGLLFMRPLVRGSSARLYGVASRSGDISGFQAFAPDCVAFDSYDALLAEPQIDAVYIPLPNHLHIEWAEKALRAGKHVLCEKPIAMKAHEIDPLIALRDETGLLCAEAYMIVHHPQWQRAREIVRQGGIGDLPIRATSATSPRPAAAACLISGCILLGRRGL